MPSAEIIWPYVSTFRQDRDPTLHTFHQTDEVLAHLQSIYGERVMDVPIPLLETLLNAAPWTFRWLQWFSQSIHRAKTAEGYASLRRRLVDDRKYDEALSVLQIADRLGAAGFVVGFDAPTLVGQALKCPDLVVREVGSDLAFHCEVSVLYSAKDLVVQSRAIESLAAPLMFHGEEPIAYSGRLLRSIWDDEIEGLRNRVVWEVMELRANPSFREVAIDETLLLAIAPEGERDSIIRWAERYRMPPYSFSGAPAGGDGRARLRLKIEDEAKQLPADQPNLLALFAHDLFLEFDIPELASLGMELLSSHPNIAVLVLMTQDFNPAQLGITPAGASILAVSDRDGLTHYSLVIQNRYSSAPYTRATQEKIQLAFSC